MLNFPVAYVLLKSGFAPETTMAAAIVIAFVCLAARLYMLRGMVRLPVCYFLHRVLLNVMVVSGVSCLFPLWSATLMEEGLPRLVLVTAVSVCSVACTVYFVGCTKAEREFVVAKSARIIRKLRNK